MQRTRLSLFTKFIVVAMTMTLLLMSLHQLQNLSGQVEAAPVDSLGALNNPASSCFAIHRSDANSTSGVYWLTDGNSNIFEAFCDMDDVDAFGFSGWTLFQQREPSMGFNVSFYRNYSSYDAGFGNVTNSHWLGLGKLYSVAGLDNHPYNHHLRVEVAFKGQMYTQDYTEFGVGPPPTNYTLQSGTSRCIKRPCAGDSLSYHNGMPFSTYDRGATNCAKAFKGGWWYRSCHSSNLNGLYLNGTTTSYADGIVWSSLTSFYYSSEMVTLKVRPYITCVNRTVTCSNRGDCDDYFTHCVCDTGFTGSKCQKPMTISLSSNLVFAPQFFNLQTSLKAEATIEPMDEYNTLNFEWSLVESLTNTSVSISTTPGTGIDSRFLSVMPNSLKENTSYRLRFKMSLKMYPNNAVYSYLNFHSSVAPVMGTLDVNPKSGKLLVDTFTLEAKNWKPTESLDTLEYRFGYLDPSMNEVVFINSFSTTNTLKTALPTPGTITLIVQGRSASGHSIEMQDTVEVTALSSGELSSAVGDKQDQLKTATGADLESGLTVLSSATTTIAATLSSSKTQNIISDVVNTIDQRRDGLTAEKKIQNVKLLSNEVKRFKKTATLQSTGVLTDTIKGSDISDVLDQAIAATQNLATVMIDKKSDTKQKSSFIGLVDEVSTKVRSSLVEGQQTSLSMHNLETVMAKTSVTSPNVTLTIPKPSDGKKSRALRLSSAEEPIVVEVNTSSIGGDTAPIHVQGQVLSDPPEEYNNKCNSKIVSPTVSLTLYKDSQQQILRTGSVDPVFTTTMGVTQSIPVNSTSYSFICKFYIPETQTWQIDTQVCRTAVVPDSNSVSCLCHEPVTHAISLDYVQSATEDETNNYSGTCTDPCGCPRKKLPTWAKAVIGLSAVAVVIVVLVITGVFGFVLYKRLGPNKASDFMTPR